MSTGDYLESFGDIANWANDFTAGTGAAPWGSVAANATGTIPDGVRTTVSTATFQASSSSGGVQRGSLTGNPSGTIVLLSTGTTDNSSACAIDLYLDFNGRNAGTLSFDWTEVNNSSGNRAGTLRVYTTTDGTTFTELGGAAVSVTNNVAASGTVSTVALPSSLNGSATARIRFYYYNGPGVAGPTGSRPRISIDNVAVTSTGGADTQPQINSVTPASVTTNAGSTVAFTVSASGGNLSYFWYKQAGSVSNLVSGANTATLVLVNVVKANATNYSVVVSNSVGTASSSFVTLNVNDPAIITQPLNQSVVAGSNASFSVTAAGTGLGYQWRKDSVNIGGANASGYVRPSVSAADQGGYDVIVSGTYGSVTSSVATLTLITPQLPTWDFNNTNDTVTAPAPATGNGTASLLGAVTASFGSGTTNDPASGVSSNGGWITTTYPTAGANNKSAGVEFAVSTSGFQNIAVRWDQRHSGTASRYTRFQYTLDGDSWVDGPVYSNLNTTANAFYVARTNDLSNIPSANNNPNFAFRIVSEFESTATGSGSASYVPTDVAGTYGSAGTIRFDFVQVYSASPAGGSPVLNIQLSGNNAVLSWTAPGYTLLAAPAVTGPYTNVPGASSQYSTPAAGTQRYFRLTNSAAGP